MDQTDDSLWHGYENSVHRASVAPCLLAAGVLGSDRCWWASPAHTRALVIAGAVAGAVLAPLMLAGGYVGQAQDALLLLALLLALRGLLDPWDISYFALPVLIASPSLPGVVRLTTRRAAWLRRPRGAQAAA
jgi:hypothetical protein